MKDVSRDNFGLLIAYVLPGFVVLWGLQPYVADVREWLGTEQAGTPTIGGFLYGTLASTAVGLFVSAIRWAVVDRLYHLTGIREPRWDFSALSTRLAAFETLVEYHYRYYQFYANMMVALGFSAGIVVVVEGRLPFQEPFGNASLILVLAVLVAGSRDALRKYYTRVSALLRPPRDTT